MTKISSWSVVADELVKVTMKDFLEDRDRDLERVHELWQKR